MNSFEIYVKNTLVHDRKEMQMNRGGITNHAINPDSQ